MPPLSGAPLLVLRDPSLRLVGAGILLFGALVSSLGVHQSLVAREVFALGDGAYSLVLLAAMAVSVVSSVAMGVAADRGPWRRATALAAATLTLAGTILMTAAPSRASFLANAALLGPAGGALFGQLFAAGRLAAQAHPPEDRGPILATVRALFAVPFMLGLPLWGLAFGAGLPLLALYPVAAVLAALLVALVWRAWPPDHAAPWPDPKSGLTFRDSLREIAARPVLGRVALVGAMHAGPAVMGVILGLLFARVGRDPGDVGLFFGVFVAVEIAGNLLAGRLGRRRPRLPLIALGVGLYALYLGALPFLAPTPWLWLLILPAGIGGGLIFPLAIGYLQDLMARRPGAGGSLIAVQRIAAESLSTGVFAAGTALQGYATVALLAAAAILAAAAALLRLDR